MLYNYIICVLNSIMLDAFLNGLTQLSTSVIVEDCKRLIDISGAFVRFFITILFDICLFRFFSLGPRLFLMWLLPIKYSSFLWYLFPTASYLPFLICFNNLVGKQPDNQYRNISKIKINRFRGKAWWSFSADESA